MCLLLKWFMENMLSCSFWKQHRLPHKTVSKSMWVREMAGLPRAGKVRPQRGSLWATLGSIFVDDGVLVKQQQKMFILTLHWGLRILFYVPATPSRTSNKVLQFVLCTSYLDWPACFPIFFHEHLSVINRTCSVQLRSLGQESHVSPGFSYSAGTCSSCLAGLWGPIESSLGLVSKWSKLWHLFSRQSWMEGWEG